jgi:hypothetical protein
MWENETRLHAHHLLAASEAMRRTIRILLSLVILTVVTAPHPVHSTTASEGPGSIRLPSNAPLFSLPAKPRPLPLRPDDGVTRAPVMATLPYGGFVASAVSAGRRVVTAKPPLLCWHTHLPRSQAGERPPGIDSLPHTPLV